MLVLLLRVGEQCFGLDASDVQAVVPSVPLVRLPGVPPWLAGLLRYRDRLVPVVDLGLLSHDRPCAPLLSTRIVVLAAADGEDAVGLLAERVTETKHIRPDRLREAAVDGAPRWLGAVALPDDGALHRASARPYVSTSTPQHVDSSARRQADTAAHSSASPVRLVRWTELVPAEIRAALRGGARA